MSSEELKVPSLGKQIWQVIYPIIIYYVISSAVIYIALMGIIMLDYTSSLMQYSSEYIAEHMTEIVNQFTSTEALASYYEVYTNYSVTVTLISNLLTMPIVCLFFFLDRKKESAQWHTYGKNPAWFGILILAGVSVCLFANALIGLMNSVNTLSPASTALDASGSANQPTNLYYQIQQSIPFQCLTAGLIAPVVEELLFRGLIFKRMRRWKGIISAVIWSSLLYAAFYGSASGMMYAFFVAVCCAYVYEQFRIIWAPILLHVSSNCISIVFTIYATRMNEILSSNTRLMLMMGFGLAMLAGCYIIIRYYMNHKEDHNNETVDNNGPIL